MKQLGMRQLSYIIPTHIHLDHGGGIGSLAELFPQATVVLHPRGVKHAIDPSRLIKGTIIAFGDDFELRYGPILPVPESQVKEAMDGEMLCINGRELQIFYAPGHAPHHVVIFDQKTGGLFCGEALGVPSCGIESFPVPSAAPPDFDVEVYLETMERLKGFRPRLLFYSHDGVGREPEKLISKAAENTLIFQDIVLKALKKGETPEAIGRRIQEYVYTHFGLKMGKVNMEMMVPAYIGYCKKKGLA
jgi:glyoxylase-like metal-dependent hydrolase (beta-lactamase superfamily II)